MNEALAYWRTLQAEVADSGKWTDGILGMEESHGLYYQGKPAMLVAEPQVLTEAEVVEDQAVASAVVAALVASGRALLADPSLQNRYTPGWLDGVPDADLFSIPAGYPDPIVFGRLDGVRTPDGLRVLEFNGGLPGGILPADASASVMAGTDIAERFRQRHPFRIMSAGEAVLDAMVKTWHDFGGTGLPYTVVAMPDELKAIATAAIDYLTGLAGARGIEIEVADPGDLVFSDGRLRNGGRPVDVLVRAFFTPMLSYLGERLGGIKAALRAESVCMITSLQSGLFGLKSLFAMATDPALDLDVPAEKLALAQAHLPWTRIVAEGSTTDPGGSTIDLRSHILANRDDLVIKPTDGYGGAGVELGWTHTAESWAAVVDGAADGRHVVQQRVPILAEEHTVLEAGFPIRRFNGDHNPLLCGGRVAGYYVRLAPETSGITNVTGGGASVAPTFILT
ncbi:MAG: hypothetical protein KDC40_13870 [Actinobacteria bacterium]|nr:hypothetical protein [Actinomycetota bacterium]